MLMQKGIRPKDSLLVAIRSLVAQPSCHREEYVDGAEYLLKHEEETHVEGQPYSWESMDDCTANFTADVTPLILAAHRFIPGHNILLLRNHFEILKMLLDRGATIPVPHDVKVGRHPLPATPSLPVLLRRVRHCQ